MKIIKKIFIWVLAVFAVIFIIAAIIIALYGKKIVESQIERNLKMKARLGSIGLSLPFTVNINNLEIGDFFKADKILISANIFSLFPGKLILGKVVLVRPNVYLVQAKDGSLNLPKLEQKAGPDIFITALIIEEGRFKFSDKKVNNEGFKVQLANINAGISKVNFPLTSLNANFRASADIMDGDNKLIGALSAKGVVDFIGKNMDANINIKDLDAVYFSPYYGNFISEKKILSATLNLNSNLKAKSNDLNINSQLNLSNLVYVVEDNKEGQPPKLNLMKNALDIFTDKDGNLSLDFTIKTKLDHPSLTIAELKKVILKAAAGNLMNSDPETLIDKVQQNINQFKEIGKQLKKIFK